MIVLVKYSAARVDKRPLLLVFEKECQLLVQCVCGLLQEYVVCNKFEHTPMSVINSYSHCDRSSTISDQMGEIYA